jgi:hypothetical protein
MNNDNYEGRPTKASTYQTSMDLVNDEELKVEDTYKTISSSSVDEPKEETVSKIEIQTDNVDLDNESMDGINFAAFADEDTTNDVNGEIVELIENIQEEDNIEQEGEPNGEQLEEETKDTEIDEGNDEFQDLTIEDAFETEEGEEIVENGINEVNDNQPQESFNDILNESLTELPNEETKNELNIENVDELLTNSDMSVSNDDDLMLQNLESALNNVDEVKNEEQAINDFTELNTLLEENVDEKKKLEEEKKEKPKPKPNLDINIDDEIAKLLNDSISFDE